MTTKTCICCFGYKGAVLSLTENLWIDLSQTAKKWIMYERPAAIVKIAERQVSLWDVPFVEVPQKYGYHSRCRTFFCNKTKLEAAEKQYIASIEEADIESDGGTFPVLSPAKTRTQMKSSVKPGSSAGILKQQCIICEKEQKYYKVQNKTVQDKLTLCETTAAGQLKVASEADDTPRGRRIQLDIGGRDCVALEVRYHPRCYSQYTKHVYNKKREKKAESKLDQFDGIFDEFCSKVVEPLIVQEHHTFRLNKLLQKFQTFARAGQLDATKYRSQHLQKRLSNKYPTLRFFQPNNPNHSKIVFAENFRHEDLLKEKPPAVSESEATSTSETDTTGGETTDVANSPVKARQKPDVSLQVLYESALMIRQDLKDHPGTEILWPPLSGDFDVAKAEAAVPVPLYNTLAWITGVSEDIQLEKFVHVERTPHLKLLSILQDVVSLSSPRKFSPKQLSLAMTVKHWTGSNKLVSLLNKYGHTVSTTSLSRFETALAQLQIGNRGGIPELLQRRTHTIYVADNIDFSEETLSGKGTTHHTNSIAIQRSRTDVGEVEERSDAREGAAISRRERSLKIPTQLLEHFERGKRRGPIQFVGRAEFVPETTWETNEADTKMIMLKTFNSETLNLPGWTGYNTQLHQKDNLIQCKIAYLPVIEASPTEMNTVMEILRRAIQLADKLELDEIDSTMCHVPSHAVAKNVRISKIPLQRVICSTMTLVQMIQVKMTEY